MYVGDNQKYPGCLFSQGGFRTFGHCASSLKWNERNVFWCPAAAANSAWNTNLNKPWARFPWMGELKIRMASVNGHDFQLVTMIGSVRAFTDKGLGGDVDSWPEIAEIESCQAGGMIMLADSKPDQSFDANIDPTPLRNGRQPS